MSEFRPKKDGLRFKHHIDLVGGGGAVDEDIDSVIYYQSLCPPEDLETLQ